MYACISVSHARVHLQLKQWYIDPSELSECTVYTVTQEANEILIVTSAIHWGKNVTDVAGWAWNLVPMRALSQMMQLGMNEREQHIRAMLQVTEEYACTVRASIVHMSDSYRICCCTVGRSRAQPSRNHWLAGRMFKHLQPPNAAQPSDYGSSCWTRS